MTDWDLSTDDDGVSVSIFVITCDNQDHIDDGPKTETAKRKEFQNAKDDPTGVKPIDARNPDDAKETKQQHGHPALLRLHRLHLCKGLD